MKKIASVFLVLALCMSLTVPTFAAFPETAEEANAKYKLTSSIDAYDFWVEEPTELSEFDYQDFEGYITKTVRGYNVIGSDTTFTLKNIDSENDHYIWVSLTPYRKDNEGRYVLEDGPGYSLRNAGFVSDVIDGMGEDMEVVLLYAGDEVTFTVPELDPDAYYMVTILQYYPEEDMSWYFEFLVRIDDGKLDEIIRSDKKTEAGNPFTDVPADAYYHDAVLWALKNKITNGTSETTFGPTETCTRGQVVTFLWRAKGCPEPTTTVNPFKDVKEKDYFYKAVLWAVENGITNGTSKTTFGPAETCTSAHVVTFLWRANGKPAAETSGTEYYAEAVAWGNANQLLAGTATPFAPGNLSPRADIVTYLYRNLAR